MKPILILLLTSLVLVGLTSNARAQSYSIDWSTIDGGGGTSTGGVYAVSGTIGQPDAGATMSGGNYTLDGGFWSIVATVQTVGLPNLIIVPNGANSLRVMWPNTGSYTLLQTPTLAGGNWTTNTGSVTTANGTNSITITPPTGNWFFRLKK